MFFNYVGISYIEKAYKNKIRWVGANEDPSIEEELKTLKSNYEDLCQEENQLDTWIAMVQNNLNDIANNEELTKFAYLTYDDIISISNGTGEEKESFLIVKAPKGTSLEVPVVDSPNNSGQNHQIILSCNNGEISTYIISDDRLSYEKETEQI